MVYKFVSVGLQPSDVIGFTENQRLSVELQATFSLVAESNSVFKNLRYPRFRNFYGYAQVMSGAYVIESIELRHVNQELLSFRSNDSSINETVGCYAKAIAAALTPPFVLTTNTVLVRQRYTSIRFRLLPGILANCGIRWEEFDAKCGGNVLPPDKKQGEPIPPNNASSSPSAGSQGQEGDGSDRSNNDGNYNPNDGNPQPPAPGNNQTTAMWHWTVKAVFARCEGDTYVLDVSYATNPDQKPSWSPRTVNPACPNAHDGFVQINGVDVHPGSGIIDSLSFDYY